MSGTTLLALIEARRPGLGLKGSVGADHVEVITTPASSLPTLARFLKADADAAYDLVDLTALDRGASVSPRFVVVLVVVSRTHQSRARLEVEVDAEVAAFPSVAGIWPAALVYEREVMDLFGLAADGHPQPVRLLLPEAFVGHPLRTDYRIGKHQPQVPPPSTTPTRIDGSLS